MSGRRPSPGRLVHERFAGRPGSGYVATGFALSGMDRWIRRRRPARVLELGPGIGATTAAIVEALDAAGVPVEGPTGPRHVGVERSSFCLEQLARNLGPDRAKVHVVEWTGDAPPGPYDMVVVDGLGAGDGDPDITPERSASETRQAVADLAPRAVVIVENRRPEQRRAIEEAVERPWARAHVRPWDGTPGYHLYLFDPTLAERAVLAARRALDRLWHPKGIRLVRHLVIRATGRELRVRPDVPPEHPDAPVPAPREESP